MTSNCEMVMIIVSVLVRLDCGVVVLMGIDYTYKTIAVA